MLDRIKTAAQVMGGALWIFCLALVFLMAAIGNAMAHHPKRWFGRNE